MAEHDSPGREKTEKSTEVPISPRQSRKDPASSKRVDRCTATTAEGRPCPARPLSGGDRCYQHSQDPKIAEQRALARRLGGLNATLQRFLPSDTSPPVLENADGVRQVLADTIQQVRTGQLSPAVGNAVVYAVATALKLAELELSAKVAKLEKAILERQGGGR